MNISLPFSRAGRDCRLLADVAPPSNARGSTPPEAAISQPLQFPILHEEKTSMYGIQQLADSMRTVRKGTIQIAEDIPESDYQDRPTPGSRSVAELLVHIAWLASADRILHEEEHIDSALEFDFVALIQKSHAEEKRPRSKAEIIELLRTEGERYVQWVEQLPAAVLEERVAWPGGGSKNRFEMLIGTKEHEMHHRAQLTVMERLVGVVPHFTRNQQPAKREAEAVSVG